MDYKQKSQRSVALLSCRLFECARGLRESSEICTSLSVRGVHLFLDAVHKSLTGDLWAGSAFLTGITGDFCS